jgi:hypothetical protein
MKNTKTTVCAVALAWCAIALTCLAPYEWLVGPPRDLFWRYWLPGLLPPLFFLVTVSFARPDLDLLCCDLAGCLAYWVGFSHDFVVVVPTLDYTTMSVACRGRELRACDRVPGATNFSDWRQQVPFVPHAPFALVHALVWVLVLFLFVRVICWMCIRESQGQVQDAEVQSSEEALLSAP